MHIFVKKYCSTLVENGYVGNYLRLGKNEYDDSGIFYAYFLAPKINYCLVINDHAVISAKRCFEGCSDEHRTIKFNDFISLSEGEIVSGRFPNDWTKRLKV